MIVSRRFDCDNPEERKRGLEQAAAAVRRGELVVLPTDTVYGVGADAFTPRAITALLGAKGRGRDMPVPVLIGSPRTLPGIATGLTKSAKALIDAFWPGGLTIIVKHQPSLQWDLGDAAGTVAVRMPLHPVAIELLNETGPMGVSSANKSGHPPATTCDEAYDQLGEQVSIYLDGGPCEGSVPSTIVDLTGHPPRVLREGVVSVAALREVVPDVVPPDVDEIAAEPDGGSA